MNIHRNIANSNNMKGDFSGKNKHIVILIILPH